MKYVVILLAVLLSLFLLAMATGLMLRKLARKYEDYYADDDYYSDYQTYGEVKNG